MFVALLLYLSIEQLYGYGSIPINTIFRGWTSIYQLFWCSPGVQGFDTLPNETLDVWWVLKLAPPGSQVLSYPLPPLLSMVNFRHGQVTDIWGMDFSSSLCGIMNRPTRSNRCILLCMIDDSVCINLYTPIYCLDMNSVWLMINLP